MNPTIRVGLLTSLCLAGCGSPEQQNSSQSTDGRLTVSDEPLVLVGDFSGTQNYSFGSVFSTNLVPGLGFLVADWDPIGLKLYDMEGQFVRSIGRNGQGPGEFGSITGVSIAPPDTIRVLDMRNRRQSTFLWDGTLVSDEPIVPEEGWPDALVGFLQDGSWIMSWLDYGPEDEGLYLDVVYFGLFNVDGSYGGQVTDQTGTWRFKMEGLPAWEPDMRPLPLAPLLNYFLIGDSLFHSDGAQSVSVWDRDGTPIRIFELPEHTTTLDAARSALATVLRESERNWTFDQVPEVEMLPRVSRILPDDQGRLWAKRYDPGTDSPWLNSHRRLPGGEWLILDLEGRLISTISLPDGFMLREVQGDLMIGIYEDEFGVESVAVHRVPRIE